VPGGRWPRGKAVRRGPAPMIPSASEQYLQGLRIFVVDDEPLICLMLENMLDKFGCVLVGVATTVEQALEMANTVDVIDVAILDVNIGDEMVFPVADFLLGRDVTCVFSTGFATALLTERYPLCRLLNKPYYSKDLAKILLASQARLCP
jgi:CheY-like chemotaxis protein